MPKDPIQWVFWTRICESFDKNVVACSPRIRFGLHVCKMEGWMQMVPLSTLAPTTPNSKIASKTPPFTVLRTSHSKHGWSCHGLYHYQTPCSLLCPNNQIGNNSMFETGKILSPFTWFHNRNHVLSFRKMGTEYVSCFCSLDSVQALDFSMGGSR